ncbi:MAG: ribonuclease HII [Candidatus Parvarchaeota archaeon]|nr:ribonuclease HII [Candidatus Parvarchaeota archaeon]
MENEVVIGIDEAGRGPVIGPMVVAGVSLDPDLNRRFKAAGVKDSKMLSIRRIYQLERIIKEFSLGFKVIVRTAAEIDDRFKAKKNLNYFELDDMSDIANSLQGKKVIVDSPSANVAKVKSYLERRVKDKEIIARNYADRDFVEVGAASILAKAQREREVEAIKKELSYDFGSGYASDPRTIEFLKIIKDNGRIYDEPYSKYIRKTWLTFKNLTRKSLNDFT